MGSCQVDAILKESKMHFQAVFSPPRSSLCSFMCLEKRKCRNMFLVQGPLVQ